MGLTRPRHHQITTLAVEFDDPILELNNALTTANTTDIGFIFNRGSTGDNVAILWDYSAQEFMLVSTTDDGDSSGNLTPSGYLDLRVGQLLTENLAFPTADGTNGQAIITDGAGNLSFGNPSASAAWGAITGTLSDQTDLQSALDTKLDSNSTTDGGFY